MNCPTFQSLWWPFLTMIGCMINFAIGYHFGKKRGLDDVQVIAFIKYLEMRKREIEHSYNTNSSVL